MGMNIKYHGHIDVPANIVAHANTIRFENYKTNTPAKFQKHFDDEAKNEVFKQQLSALMNIDPDNLDYVYFSVCQGAEPHTDQLDPHQFADITYIIPVILPQGDSVITALNDSATVELGGVYSFNHTETHSMILEDNESGCVVIMAAERFRKR